MRINLPNPKLFSKLVSDVTGNKLDSPVLGVTTDSRDFKQGDFYIALEGERTDGHNYLPDLESLGCTAALVSKRNDSLTSLKQVVVGNTVTTIGEIANLWQNQFHIPTIAITGTNGKTTTVRLLKAMVDAQGKVPGLSTTDWLMVGDKILDQGDWSGPGGARNILRNERVDIALLETARGGMLRRGLALGLREADVVLINNIAADHLGEWGIQDLDMLADTKFVIRHAGRHVVLNAEDEKSVERRHWVDQPLTWFSLDSTLPLVLEHEVAGGKSATLRNGQLCWTENGQCTDIISVNEVPMTLGGAAKHNIANALAAISVAKELGISEESISEGLRSFLSNPRDNPGRMNQFDVGGVSVFVDFAHNPHGLAALLEMTASLPAKRRLVTLGHAGDRNDENLIALAQTAAASAPDCILIKEQPGNLRGRKTGEVPKILKNSLLKSGYPEAKILHADDELQATEMALDWAKPGDLLLLLTLDRRADVLRLVQMAQQK